MSTYREIIGKKIKKVSSDPSSGLDGEMWYNSTTGQIRGLAISQAWASASPMITARSRAGGTTSSNSTQSAGLAFGGQDSTGVLALNEEYNGSGWSTGGALGTARRWHYGAGSQTAALCAGGVAAAAATPVTANSEEYNGSAWTEGENMGTGRYNGGSGGTQTAAFATGGSPAPSYTNATEEYDGTDWTAGGVLPVSKGYFGGGGTLTAGIVMGIGASSTDSYEYDGSSWTAGGTMNRGCSQGSYAGLQTDGISFGGTPPTTATEHYNGTAWTNYPAMATARYALAGASGTASAAMGSGGYAPPDKNTTEEFTSSTNVITAGAWSSAPALNTARGSIGSAGIQTAALAVSGEPPAPGGKVESYDGSSWTEVGALSTGRSQLGSVGTQTAALAFGGEPAMANTETWNGSSWTASPNSLNTAAKNMAAFGSQAAAVKAGGFGSPPSTYLSAVETWNGSSWTASPNSLPATNAQNRGFGTSTAGVNCAGLLSPGAVTGNTSEWDGSNWTTSGSMITARSLVGTAGTQTDGLIAGGYTTANSVLTEGYDGTAWSTRPSLALARQAPGGLGTNSVSTASLVCGGNIPPSNAATATVEIFTGETETANIKNFTTS